MIPDYDLYPFVVLAALFFVAFIWLVSELTFPLLPGTWPVMSRRFASVALGLAAYALAGFTVWLAEPVTHDTVDETGFRAFMSVAWSAGLFLKAGSFSDYSCGY